MTASISRVSALLVGVAFLLTGHGLQLALIPLRGESMGWSDTAVGLLSSIYFCGFLLGCFIVPGLVRQIGHIRCFSSLTALLTAVLLMHPLLPSYLSWLLLRFLSGVAIAGLYLAIESWLNEQVENEERGGMLAAYTVIVLLALAVGQLLLNVAPIDGDRLFIISALFVALAAIPVGITRSSQPALVPTATFSPLLVLRTSRVASVGVFISGLVTGSFYGLAPLYGRQIGLEVTAISVMMAFGIVGGALSQLPLGKLSDRIDRRLVIIAIMLSGALVSYLALLLGTQIIPVVMLFYGASVMPIYALSLAHASDNVSDGSFMEIGTGLLVMNALGAIAGPLITAQAMEIFGPDTFFVVSIVVLVTGSLILIILTRARASLRKHFSKFRLATTAAAQGAIMMDPRCSDEESADQSVDLI